MTYTEVLELIRAGYTKKEIDAMMQDKAKEDKPVKTENDKPKEEKNAKVAEDDSDNHPDDHQQVKEKEPSETDKLVEALGLKMDALTSAIQTRNINNIEGNSTAETTEDILAKIINPNYGGK